MTGSQIDYAAVYEQLPVPVLLLTPELAVADVNLAFLRTTGRTREELLGRNIFGAFPGNPSDPSATGARDSNASLRRILATGEPGAVDFQKDDTEVPGSPGQFGGTHWGAMTAPVFGADGRVVLIAQCVEEVTGRLRRFRSALAADAAVWRARIAGRSGRPRPGF